MRPTSHIGILLELSRLARVSRSKGYIGGGKFVEETNVGTLLSRSRSITCSLVRSSTAHRAPAATTFGIVRVVKIPERCVRTMMPVSRFAFSIRTLARTQVSRNSKRSRRRTVREETFHDL